MAGWLDDFLKAQATGEPSAGTGLLAMLQATAGSPFDQGAPAAPPLYAPTPMFPGNPYMGPAMPQPPAPDLPSGADIPSLPQPPADLPRGAGMVPPAATADYHFPPDAQGSALPAPPAAAAPSDILGSIGRHILQGLRDNSNSLIAGGGAMISGGLGKGFSAMAEASPLDIAARRERQGNEAVALTQKALEARGIDSAQARAMAIDPAYRKEMMQPQQHVTLTDAYGNQRLVRFDPLTGRGFELNGQPIGQGTGGGGLQSQLPEGPDWFEKLPRELQVEAKNYATGLAAGTANPRKGMPQIVKDVASRWADEHGLIIDENNLLQRRTMMNNLAKDQQGTTGGQLLFGRTAIHHLAEAAEGLTKLNNKAAGYAPLTAGINQMRGLTDAQKAELAAVNTSAAKYGNEITKFYVGSGGTHGEREHNAELGIYDAPEVQASILEAEKKLIPGRLEEIGNHIRDTLGEAAYQKWYVGANKSLNGDLARIDAAIDKLRGKPRAASEGELPPGAVKNPDGSITYGGATIRAVGK